MSPGPQTAGKDKHEPSKFLGDGVAFRAKLIGVLEVAEARGDRMCQEALADLKMAVRAAGEHKQRIQVHVAIDGLRLRDDKTGDSLYHHPVHKISFIAQDMTDSRAFGYIFGSPDTGHRFFGIKTDKAASQVVIAMRDLFQVVFELKKKEVELAKQQLEGKSLSGGSRHYTCITTEPPKTKTISQVTETATKPSEACAVGGRGEDGVAELVDLEQELCSLRRGLTQVEGLTPPTSHPDPFGDSFTPPPTSGDVKKGLLPPPPVGSTGRSRSSATTAATTPRSSHNFSPSRASNTSALGFDLTAVTSNTDVTSSAPVSFTEKNEIVPIQNSATNPSSSLAFDVFTELDPLGTGRSKPYVDKKHFFQELKNPPKKVLKDFVSTVSSTTASVNLLTDIMPCVTTATESVKTETTYSAQTITSVGRHSGGSVSIMNHPPQVTPMFTGSHFTLDPFAETDPFDSADPFTDCFKEDPFGANMNEFAATNINRMEEFRTKLSREISHEAKEESERPPAYGESGKNIFNGPLQVSLPPEPAPKSPRLPRQINLEPKQSSIRQRPQPSSKLNTDGASPPPPLPPKKVGDSGGGKPPPRPPHSDVELIDSGAESGPALPRPARRKEPCPDRSIKPRLSSVTTNSSEDEYLSPVPPPLPKGLRQRPPHNANPTIEAAPGLDMTLSQLLTCGLEELAVRLSVPASRLATMTLQQLTAYLKDYLMAKNTSTEQTIPEKPPEKLEKEQKLEFKTNFEDSYTGISGTNFTFVANFDDFDKKVDPSYDKYAAFREIQEEELKGKSLLDPVDIEQNEEEEEGSDRKEEEGIHNLDNFIKDNNTQRRLLKEEISDSYPQKPLDELTINSLTALYRTVGYQRKQINKMDDMKSVINNINIEQPTRSVTPKDNIAESKPVPKSQNDRYAALREISIIEPQDEYESIPPEAPKERKKSDEKSDGFDNSDFFDCIDNSSLSFSHMEDAFRKSPSIKSPVPEQVKVGDSLKVDGGGRKVKVEEKLASLSSCVGQTLPAARLSTGSLSDVVSGSSPEAGNKEKSQRRKLPPDSSGPAWTVFPPRSPRSPRGSPRSEEGASPWSSDSKDSEGKDKWGKRESPPAIPRPRRRQGKNWHTRQTSSSSRDVSPWDEDPPPLSRSHHRSSAHSRDSRHNSSGSRDRLDSGSGRDKRDLSRDRRDRDIQPRDLPTRDRDIPPRDRDIPPRDRDIPPRDRDIPPRDRDIPTRDRDIPSRDRDIPLRDRDITPRDREIPFRDRDIPLRDRDIPPRERDIPLRDRDIPPRDRDIPPRDRDIPPRDRRDSGSGRDRRESKDRGKGKRERDEWDKGRDRDYRDSKSRDRVTRDREKGRRRNSWEDEDYSDVEESGRSSPTNHRNWRRDERNYGSLGWRESRRRADSRQSDDTADRDRRYGATLGNRGRRSAGPRLREPEPRRRNPRREPPREEPRHRSAHSTHTTHSTHNLRADRFRFSNDFSEHDSPRDQSSPFENDFVDTPSSAGPRKKGAYSSLEGTRFAFDRDDETTASPASAGSRIRDAESPATRFRFDSDSISPRSLFEDDFANESRPTPSRAPATSIAEEDETCTTEIAPREAETNGRSRSRPKTRTYTHQDIKKSESVNIFVRETDPFEGDDFFACTGSDRAARRDNWPGDFPAFDDV